MLRLLRFPPGEEALCVSPLSFCSIGACSRAVSPPSGRSILMTSAPWSGASSYKTTRHLLLDA